ncbi:MAG: hypothetical protein SVY15_02040 [Halobacteriota archaeon]|nr:hypothetical protein [Halobacteriota archaeon]
MKLKRLQNDQNAQMHTMEAAIVAIMMIGAVSFVSVSSPLVHPEFMVIQLQNYGEDTLEIISQYPSIGPDTQASWEDGNGTWVNVSTTTNMTVGGSVALDTTTYVETLRPNAQGSETALEQDPSSGDHWDKVDEVTPDDTSTFVYRLGGSFTGWGDWARDLYNIQDHTDGSGTINNITVHYRVQRYFQNRDGRARASIRTHGMTYDSPYHQIDNSDDSWHDYSEEWVNNPNSLQPWTWAEVDDLEVGTSLSRYYVALQGSRVRCTQAYLDVNYDGYYKQGNLTSNPINSSDLDSWVSWGNFYANATVPANTDIIYSILDEYDNFIMNVVSGQDISGLAYSTIKLHAELSTTNVSRTPTLHDWNVTYWKTPPQDPNMLVEYIENESWTTIDALFRQTLPDEVNYNMYIIDSSTGYIFVDTNGNEAKIEHGLPGPDSVTVSKMVYADDPRGIGYNLYEVRFVLWYK